MNLVTDPYTDAIARQIEAAANRDATALRAASADLVHAEPYTAQARRRGAGDPPRYVASVILAGHRIAHSRSIRAIAYRQTEGGEVPLAEVPEEDWDGAEVPLLAELRILERDWRCLPPQAMRELALASSTTRRRIRTFDRLFGALGTHDSAQATAAIRAVAHQERPDFSLLAYVLFEEARRLDLDVQVPRAYAF
jgi:hypothetical protein